MPSDNTLTGARLVEAVINALVAEGCIAATEHDARAALRAQAEAAGVTERGPGTDCLNYAATVLNTAGGEWCERVAAFLCAMAEVLRDE